MQPIYKQANDKDLRHRGIPLNTLVTPDNDQLFLSKAALVEIANRVSFQTGQSLTQSGAENLIQFLRSTSINNVHGKPLGEAYNILATEYLRAGLVKAQLIEQNESTSAVRLTNLDQVTDMPTIDDYQKKEIAQFTSNENQYKYAAFADRRGNAVVDHDRVLGNRSSPNSLPSGFKPSIEDVNRENYEALRLVKNFLNPEYINELIGRYSSSYTNFSSISLPHQTIPLDSRNRLMTNQSNSEYTWNIHSAGLPGQVGDVRIQDTIQQVIQMTVGSFWLPLPPSVGTYYGKIRMLIREFAPQSNLVTEFLTITNAPSTSSYHFEFNVQQIVNGRAFLTPVNPTYSFRKPFAQLNTLTLSFRTPFNILIFDPDRGVYTITYGNPTLFTIINPAFTGLNTGDLIYVLNSNSGSAVIDNALTNTAGWIITKVSNTSFTIPLDSSALIGTQVSNVYYGAKRLVVPVEFLCLEQ